MSGGIKLSKIIPCFMVNFKVIMVVHSYLKPSLNGDTAGNIFFKQYSYRYTLIRTCTSELMNE